MRAAGHLPPTSVGGTGTKVAAERACGAGLRAAGAGEPGSWRGQGGGQRQDGLSPLEKKDQEADGP